MKGLALGGLIDSDVWIGQITTDVFDMAKQMPTKLDEGLGVRLPDNPIMVRADMNTEFKYIQRIMEVCGKKGIQIWKLELGAAEHEDTRKKREAAARGEVVE